MFGDHEINNKFACKLRLSWSVNTYIYILFIYILGKCGYERSVVMFEIWEQDANLFVTVTTPRKTRMHFLYISAP